MNSAYEISAAAKAPLCHVPTSRSVTCNTYKQFVHFMYDEAEAYNLDVMIYDDYAVFFEKEMVRYTVCFEAFDFDAEA